MRMTKTLAAVGLSAMLAVGLAACGDEDELSAEEQYCTDLVELETSVDELLALRPATATIDEINEARDAVREDIENLADAADEVGSTRIDDLNEAYENLDGAIDDLSGDDTIPQALQGLRPDIEAVVAARQEVFSEINCAEVAVESNEDE